MTEKTCSERIADSLFSRATDIRLMLNPSENDIEIADNGTLDTVLSIGDRSETYSQEYASAYRNEDTGELDTGSFISDHFDEIREKSSYDFSEYGLAFDYVEPNTFDDQKRGYFRYQISWGGPSEEFRFYTDENLSLTNIEYWFLDWYDGATITIHEHHEHYATAKLLWDQFAETGTIEHLLSEAA